MQYPRWENQKLEASATMEGLRNKKGRHPFRGAGLFYIERVSSLEVVPECELHNSTRSLNTRDITEIARGGSDLGILGNTIT